MPQSLIDWTVVRAAAACRVAAPRTPVSGRVGERLGAGIGSSLEFQDHRPYAPGDDLRHVDWAAYARSETLSIRVYREEVAPRIDLVLDLSRSMAVTPAKARASAEIAALLACAAVASGPDVRLATGAAGDPPRLHRPEDVERVLDWSAAASVVESPHVPLRRRSLRVVLSDFLFPHDADVLVGRLARDGASLALVQLTLPEEADPAAAGGQRLIDVESGAALDLMIDRGAVDRYRQRFERLRAELTRAARRVGATFVHVRAGMPLNDVARALVNAGVLEAA